MRKSIIALAAVTAIVPGFVTPAQATSGTPGCVTKAEFRLVYADGSDPSSGMTQLEVARKFGRYYAPYWGTKTYTSEGSYGSEVDRRWRICSSSGRPMSYDRGEVEVDFYQNYDYDGDYAYGPMRANVKYRWAY